MCENLLYKYSSWNNYTQDSLEHRYFWFSKPAHFNDPFDCNMDILRTSSKLINLFPLNSNGETFLDNISAVIKEIGVMCFTEKTSSGIGSKGYDNLHFWSHYADSHKGIAIGFDKSKIQEYSSLLLANLELRKVNYYDSGIDIDTHEFDTYNGKMKVDDIFEMPFDGKKYDAFIDTLLTTKDARYWSNENESRIILSKLALHVIKTNPDLKKYLTSKDEGYQLSYPEGDVIKEVTFGVNFEGNKDETIELIRSTNSNVTFYEASLDLFNASIVRTEI